MIINNSQIKENVFHCDCICFFYTVSLSSLFTIPSFPSCFPSQPARVPQMLTEHTHNGFKAHILTGPFILVVSWQTVVHFAMFSSLFHHFCPARTLEPDHLLHILPLPLTSCVTLGKSLTLSMPHFPHLKTGVIVIIAF